MEARGFANIEAKGEPMEVRGGTGCMRGVMQEEVKGIGQWDRRADC